MENVIKKLRIEFYLVFVGAFVLAGLFELDVWTPGWAAVGNERADYYVNLTGIIMVIVLVPAALKVMSFRTVKSSFSTNFPEQSALRYKRWSEVRMAMLAVTGWANIVFYYLTLDSTGAICALITALALCFCRPSREKFAEETGLEPNHDGVEAGNQGKA